MAAPFTCFSLMCGVVETPPPDGSNWGHARRDLCSLQRQRLQAVVDGAR